MQYMTSAWTFFFHSSTNDIGFCVCLHIKLTFRDSEHLVFVSRSHCGHWFSISSQMNSRPLGNVPKCFLPLRSNWMVAYWFFSVLRKERKKDLTSPYLKALLCWGFSFGGHEISLHPYVPLPPILYLPLQCSVIDVQYIWQRKRDVISGYSQWQHEKDSSTFSLF